MTIHWDRCSPCSHVAGLDGHRRRPRRRRPCSACPPGPRGRPPRRRPGHRRSLSPRAGTAVAAACLIGAAADRAGRALGDGRAVTRRRPPRAGTAPCRPGRAAPARGAAASAVAVAATAALVLLPGTAAADVTVAASRAEADARDVTITFRVTNADPAVPTTGLQVFLPTARPLLGVRPAAPTGWRRGSTRRPGADGGRGAGARDPHRRHVGGRDRRRHRPRGVPARRGPAARRRGSAAVPRGADLRGRDDGGVVRPRRPTARRRPRTPRWWSRTRGPPLRCRPARHTTPAPTPSTRGPRP